MVRIAYLILAHANPRHLARLIDRLMAPEVWFYVHLDRKSDRAQFDAIRHPRVVFCEQRVDCAWGDISLVEATLVLAREALRSELAHEYFVLLSGACYPLQSPDYIADFLARHRGQEFIEVFGMPDALYGKPVERLRHYWIRKSAPFKGLKWRLQRLLNRVIVARDYRASLDGGEPMAGSQWWALSHAALSYAVEQVRLRARFYAFCRHTDCPDEYVFQTILWNSPFRAAISHSLTYTRWLAGRGGPENVDASDLAWFAQPLVRDAASNNCPNEKREVLFARKFSDASTALLDQLDQLIAARPAGADVSPQTTITGAVIGQDRRAAAG